MAGRNRSQDNETAARKVAEAAMPGWEVSETHPSPSGAIAADYVGRDSDALKEKYLGTAPDARPKRAKPNEDAEFIDMKPKEGGPIKSRKVVVSGGTVTGFQG